MHHLALRAVVKINTLKFKHNIESAVNIFLLFVTHEIYILLVQDKCNC